MKNKLVADIFYEIADLLDIKGEIFFKTRAYRMAAQTIEVLDEDIEKVVKEDRVEEIPGVGGALAKKIREIVETGELKYLEDLKKEVPESLLEMLDIHSLGPKKVSAIYKNLGIKSIAELEKAAREGRLRDLEGFGEITEKLILRGISLKRKTQGRVLLNLAYEDGLSYVDYMKGCKVVNRISLAGSLRRMKETIGDVDILVSSDEADEVMDFFVDYDDVKRVLLKGSTKTSVLLEDNLQVDLRVVEDKSFGAALQYFTGSKEHNVKMRGIAIKNGFKLNEYGLFKKDSKDFVVGGEEEEVYSKLGLDYIAPQLRENRGEIEAADKGELPSLLELDDINGDFHVHSVYSDGKSRISEIVQYAKGLGYSFVGISDHSESLKVAGGLSERDVDKKLEEISRINKKEGDFRVFCGTECDIKSDGSLDYADSILKKFDFVAAAIHSNFKMSEKQATDRIVKALENEYVNFLAHPTCRMIGSREALKLDLDKVFNVALERDVYMEVNSFPDRLDLNDLNIRKALDMGVKLVVNTDAHTVSNMDFMKYGVSTARRGWAEKKDVLNTLSVSDLCKKFNI